MNEPLTAVIVGLLLSLSAGVRVTVPLLTVNLLAYFDMITLPTNLAGFGSFTAVLVLCFALVIEATMYFLPKTGTALKAIVTPLAFAAGTLLMALCLGSGNPTYQWTMAAIFGGGTATLMHIAITGMRAMTEPGHTAMSGYINLAWSAGEFVISFLLVFMSGICVEGDWEIGAVSLLALFTFMLIIVGKAVRRWSRLKHS